MNSLDKNFYDSSQKYLDNLHSSFSPEIIDKIEELAKHCLKCWESEKNIFICWNGGSAANAIHIANDLHYGAGACGSSPSIKGLKVEALTSNSAVITCLGNDIGYENIFSHQLNNKAAKGDLLIVLSGSGNSQNIINALLVAKELEVHSFAILGFKGGKCRNYADSVIHFLINDMQIAEDTQLIVGHLCMQWLTRNKPKFNN